MLEILLAEVSVEVPWGDMGQIVSDIDLNLHNLMFYALTLTILIENLYQLTKPFFKKKIKTKELDNTHGIAEKETDYKNAVVPPIIGIIVALTIFPTTYFSFMPFQPAWVGLEIIYTAIIFGRVANMGHSAFDKIQELGLSLIGRIIGIKRY